MPLWNVCDLTSLCVTIQFLISNPSSSSCIAFPTFRRSSATVSRGSSKLLRSGWQISGLFSHSPSQNTNFLWPLTRLDFNWDDADLWKASGNGFAPVVSEVRYNFLSIFDWSFYSLRQPVHPPAVSDDNDDQPQHQLHHTHSLSMQ